MRLPVETFRRLALGLTAALTLSGCAAFSGGDDGLAGLAPAPAGAPGMARGAGPAADYPVVVGEPYRLGANVYTPADTLNYDEVGYAVPEAAIGVTASHHTLPLPSYVEVTSLDTGRTILVRVERRGPMTSDALIALSPMALNQLGGSAGTPVRVRRVNPQEEERSVLRLGQSAPNRMDTPESLVAVLKRKLPASGAAQLAAAPSPALPRPVADVPVAPSQVAREYPQVASAQQGSSYAPTRVPTPAPAARNLPRPALPPLGAPQQPPMAQQAAAPSRYQAGQPVVVARLPEAQAPAQPYQAQPYQAQPYQPQRVQPAQAAPIVNQRQIPARPPYQAAVSNVNGAYVVQVAALTSLEGAQRVAGAIDGRITQAGAFYRVRTGPFTTRGQAEASLAKVRAAGYSEARIFTNG